MVNDGRHVVLETDASCNSNRALCLQGYGDNTSPKLLFLVFVGYDEDSTTIFFKHASDGNYFAMHDNSHCFRIHRVLFLRLFGTISKSASCYILESVPKLPEVYHGMVTTWGYNAILLIVTVALYFRQRCVGAYTT